MALTRQQLEDAVREHIGAEASRDLDHLRETLDEGVRYEIMAPAFADDPKPYGRFEGAETYINMWKDLYEVFDEYEIQLLGVYGDEERQRAWLQVQVTALPSKPWRGLPPGRRVRWWAAAICEFDEQGLMTKEIVYGSLPPTLTAFELMAGSEP